MAISDVINLCAPMNSVDVNIQAIRKGIFAELFILYLTYLAITMISYLKNPEQDYKGLSKGDDGAAPQNQPQPQQQFISAVNLNKFFTVFFGYHVVPIGMVLLFCPYTFSIVVAYLHLLGFFAVLIGYKLDKDAILKAGYAFAQFTNLLLIMGALVELGNTSECKL